MSIPETGRLLMESLMKFNKLHMRIKPRGGLRASELYTLFTIRTLVQESGEGVRVTDVSTRLEVAPPTVSQNINILEKHGYIHRTHSTQDRRTVLLELSSKGKELFVHMENDLLKRCIDLSEYLGVEESRLLSDLLLKSFEFLKDYNYREES